MIRGTLLAILGAGTFLAMPAPAAVLKAPLHPRMYVPRAQLGGLVSEVLVATGQHVKSGQLLVSFDAKELETRLAQLQLAARSAQAAMTSGNAMAQIPPQARQYIYDVHPETMKAEEEYVEALTASESATVQNRAAAAARLKKAAEERTLVRSRIAKRMAAASNGDDLQSFLEQTTHSIAETQKLLKDTGIRAPANAIVDLIEVRAGDRIRPGAPLAILVSAEEYALEFAVTAAEATTLREGMTLEVQLLGDAAKVRATIVSIATKKIPVIARDNLQTAEESLVRLSLHSTKALRAGLIATMELP